MGSNLKDILIRSEVFGSVPEADLEKLILFADERKILSGDILATAKQTAQYFFVLIEGALLLELENDKAVVLSTPGDFVGFELISTENVYSATLIALENGYILALPKQEMMDLIREDTETAQNIMQAWRAYLEKTAPFLIEN